MSIQVKRRREAAAFLNRFTGAQAELIVDTTNSRVQVHDGATPGGWPAAKLAETQTIGYTQVADADYAVTVADALVAVTALTGSHTLTLPASATYPAGRVLRILDASGRASPSTRIVVAVQNPDGVDGGSSLAIQAPFGSLELVSNGAGKWFALQDSISSLGNLSQLAVNTAVDPTNPISATLNSALLNALSSNYSGTGDIRLKLNKQAAANTGSLLLQDGFSGRAEIGLCGDDDLHFKVSSDGANWVEALRVSAQTGAVSFVGAIQIAALNGGALAGNRNRIINGSFQVNQRAVASGVSLAAGFYGFDRWKAGSGGAALTFSAAAPDTALTIASGTLVQVIEGVNVEGGNYVLSWRGSSQARVSQGALPTAGFSAGPIRLSGLASGANIFVEFAVGSVGLVQLEPGLVATPFERRPLGAELMLCMRYFQTSYDPGVAPGSASATPSLSTNICGSTQSATIATIVFPTPMRGRPTGTIFSPKSGASGSCYRNNAAADAPASFQNLTSTGCSIGVSNTVVANEGLQANYTMSAEI